eukprot:scaffold8167_cov235-Skeletonema_menzelii.AAC.1
MEHWNDGDLRFFQLPVYDCVATHQIRPPNFSYCDDRLSASQSLGELLTSSLLHEMYALILYRTPATPDQHKLQLVEYPTVQQAEPEPEHYLGASY